MNGSDLAFLGGALLGLYIIFGTLGEYTYFSSESRKKLKEWEKIKIRLETLLEKSPEISENKEIVVGATQNGNIALNKKAKESLKEALTKWEEYGRKLKSYPIRAVFPTILSVIHIIFCIYLWGVILGQFEMISPLKSNKDAIALYILLPGWLVTTLTFRRMIQLPESPIEEFKSIFREPEPEERKTNLGTESSSTDTISLGAAGVEPYSTIYGFRHDD